MVLVTATMSKPREGIDFFPLTIDFEERLYARGRIPGGFPRREGRPTTDTVLTMRLTDRPLRPLFPKDFRNEVQIITTPMSADLETPLDIMSIVGASTSLSISDIPFNGPIGVTRIGCVDGEFVINPTYQQSDESTLDLVVAGSRDGVLMMEAGASEVSDEMVLEAIKLAQDTNLQLIELQDEIIEAVAKPKSEYSPFGYPKELDGLVDKAVEGKLADAMSPEGGKADMSARLSALKGSVTEGSVKNTTARTSPRRSRPSWNRSSDGASLSLASVPTDVTLRRSARSFQRREFPPEPTVQDSSSAVRLRYWPSPRSGLWATSRRSTTSRPSI